MHKRLAVSQASSSNRRSSKSNPLKIGQQDVNSSGGRPDMELVKQFSIMLVNKPGVLAQVTEQLADAKVNILAMTMMDSSEHGVLRVVAENPQKVRDVLKPLNLPTTESDVLMVDMANRSGSLAEVCNKLADAHVNINYAYCTTGARGGKTNGIFKVSDLKKAMKVLKLSSNKKLSDNKKRLRRPPARK